MHSRAGPEAEGAGGGVVTTGVDLEQQVTTAAPAQIPSGQQIVFRNVSKFYGEVLGINRVNLSIPPGVTSLVGPNGSGKTTLMNLMTGLIRPTCGDVRVLGLTTDQSEEFGRMVGYCTQFDSFPKGVTGGEFVQFALRLHGYSAQEAASRAEEALERVGMTAAAQRKVAAYSKGMRQRIRLAHAIAHKPSVVVLDEPLNGLDPMARAESLALFQQLGREGLHVIISSHILHEVDQISDQVILLSYGYVVAEGRIHGVREEVKEHPMQILIRCHNPALLASRVFAMEIVVEAKLVPAEGHLSGGVLVRTRDADAFHLALNRIVLEDGIQLTHVAPADDDVLAVYQYLIGPEGASA
jgi:ABC-2 type transport system ATP-binding protein